MVHFFLKLKKKKKYSSSSSASLALPTQGERANNTPVTSDTPSEQKIRKDKSSQKCHPLNQRHTVNPKAHQNPENIQLSEYVLVAF